MLFLNNEQILAVLEWNGLASYVEKGLEEITATSNSTVPPRTIIQVPDPALHFYTMPAYSKYNNTVTCKLITQCPNNQEKYQIPSVSGVIVVFNVENGQLEAVLEAEALTEWRTAAGSLVAAKHLWKFGKEDGGEKILAVLGAGKQGEAHIKAFQNVYRFTTVNLWNRTQARAHTLAQILASQGINVNVIEDPKACVNNADIIIWAASAAQVYIDKKDIKTQAFIISVGTSSQMPSGLSSEIFHSAQLFTESVISAQSEMKSFIEDNHLEFSELGGLIGGGVGTGDAELSRKILEDEENPKDLIVYQSLGSGMMDAAAAKFVLENYRNY